jgi:phage repressor protein C with HTH and peptisase S24 domain
MQFDELLDTLQNLIIVRPSIKDIANALGVQDKAIYARKSRNSELTFEELRKIENAYGIVGGLTGSMVQADSNTVDLEYYSDVWASCGTGAIVFEETTEKLSVPKSLIQNYSSSNRYSVINSRGDSMTPFIQDRDKLIVEHWNGGQIIDNCIYVFRYANELFVKRLVKNITQIVIKSDNPLYEPIKITDKDQDFEVIGQIVGLMRDLR